MRWKVLFVSLIPFFFYVSLLIAQTAVDFDTGTLIWTTQAGPAEEGFRISCGPQSKQYTKLLDVLSPSARSVLVKDAAGLGIWFCMGTAYNKGGESPPSNEVNIDVVAAPVIKVPPVPTGLTVTAESLNTIRMSWALNSTTAQSNFETSLEIERKVSEPPAGTVIKGIPARTTIYTDTNLNKATTYCYRIRAVNSAGVSAYSVQSCGTTLAQ